MQRALRLACLLVLAAPGCFGELDPDAFDVPVSEDRGDARDGEGGAEADADAEPGDADPEAGAEGGAGDVAPDDAEEAGD
jgi:hypothetical protein